MMRLVAMLGFVVLLVLHFDAWRTPSAAPWWGWLPDELGWRLLWMLGALGYLWWFTSRFWKLKS